MKKGLGVTQMQRVPPRFGNQVPPAGQVLQSALPVVFLYLPASHALQNDAPDPLYVPASHREHDDAPDDEKLPAAQSEQLVAPALLYMPSSQSEHPDWPVAD